MFNFDVLIPQERRNQKNLLANVAITNEEIAFESDVLLKCTKDQFYQLLKNEPMKYLNIIENDGDLKNHVSNNFHLTLTRKPQTNQLSITLKVKDEHPVVLENEESDKDLIENLEQYITAKNKEQYNLPIYSNSRREKTRLSQNLVKKQEKTLSHVEKQEILKYICQVESLIQKIKDTILIQ